MPQVGRRHFPYTATGRSAAKKYAKSSGQKMKKTKKKGGY